MQRFTIPGKPVGYFAVQRKFHDWKRENAYHGYMAKTRVFARQADIRTPLLATLAKTKFIYTCAFFEDGHHADPENVHKGIKDALFYGSNDKYTWGVYLWPLYDKDNPRVEVEIFDGDDWQGIHALLGDLQARSLGNAPLAESLFQEPGNRVAVKGKGSRRKSR